jgi:hypothetical protein
MTFLNKVFIHPFALNWPLYATAQSFVHTETSLLLGAFSLALRDKIPQPCDGGTYIVVR